MEKSRQPENKPETSAAPHRFSEELDLDSKLSLTSHEGQVASKAEKPSKDENESYKAGVTARDGSPAVSDSRLLSSSQSVKGETESKVGELSNVEKLKNTPELPPRAGILSQSQRSQEFAQQSGSTGNLKNVNSAESAKNEIQKSNFSSQILPDQTKIPSIGEPSTLHLPASLAQELDKTGASSSLSSLEIPSFPTSISETSRLTSKISGEGSSENGLSALRSLAPQKPQQNISLNTLQDMSVSKVEGSQPHNLQNIRTGAIRVESNEAGAGSLEADKYAIHDVTRRSASLSPTEGKIAGTHPDHPSELKATDKTLQPNANQPAHSDGNSSSRSPFDLKTPQGLISDSKSNPETVKAGHEFSPKPTLKPEDNISTKQPNKAGDKPLGDKVSSGSSGPSAFIQFIENQAGLRGTMPAADKSSDKTEKGQKEGKPDSSKADSTKAPGKIETTKAEGSRQGPKADSPKADVTKSGAGRNDLGSPDGPKIPGVNLDGLKNKVDGFLGLVDNVKENLKDTFKPDGKRTPPQLAEGELVAVSLKGQLPPLRDRIVSAQSIAVWFPAGFASWNIVRSPSAKLDAGQVKNERAQRQSEKTLPAPDAQSKPPAAKIGEPLASAQPQKPFDINNPPDKSRPFVQLHGADSEYKGSDGRTASAPNQSGQIKWEPMQTQPVKPPALNPEITRSQKNIIDPGRADAAAKSDSSKAVPTSLATPFLDLPGKRVPFTSADQSSTRPVISPELAERRRLAEEQENTVQTSDQTADQMFLESKEDLRTEEIVARDQLAPDEHDHRMRYVNSDIDAQESTWNSEEDAEEPQHMSMNRYAYIVQTGDTVESVAVAELHDLSLAPLLYSKNRRYVLPEAEYGIHPFLEGVVIDLPTPAEIAAFRQF